MSGIFVNKCAVCGQLLREGEHLCYHCRRVLIPINGKICAKCGREKFFCVCGKAPIRFVSRTAAPFYYDGAARQAVVRLKFGGGYGALEFFADKMQQSFEAHLSDQEFDAICCVPSSARSLQQRGFNQSAQLAKRLSRRLNLPFMPRLLRRVLPASTQHTLPALHLRSGNVFGIFEADVRRVRGLRILLVDDVMTTGSTAGECAKMLRLRGASQVCVLTAALGK